MSKFHINKHGVPAPCKATKGNCPLGGDDSHFNTKEEAQEHVDKQNEEKYGVIPGMESHEGGYSQQEIEEYERKHYEQGILRYADEDEKADIIQNELYSSFAKLDGLTPGTKEYGDTATLRSNFEMGAGVYDVVDILNDSTLSADEVQSQVEATLEDYFPMSESEITVRHRPLLFRRSVNEIMKLRKSDTAKRMREEKEREEKEKREKEMNVSNSGKSKVKKTKRPKEETIISAEDDIVVVTNPKTGKVLYKGLEDYEPGKRDDWKYNEEKGVYTFTHEGVEYEKKKIG